MKNLEDEIRLTLADRAKTTPPFSPPQVAADPRHSRRLTALAITGASVSVVALAIASFTLHGKEGGTNSGGQPSGIEPSTYSTVINTAAPSFCQDSAVSISYGTKKIPLASCNGELDLATPTTVTLRVGQRVLVAGLSSGASLLPLQRHVAVITGRTIAAVRAGVAIIHVEDEPLCSAASATCAVARIVVKPDS